MLLHVPSVLTADELQRVRGIVDAARWSDGKITAGTQSAQVKNNRQLPQDCRESREAREIVLAALDRSALFVTGALPRRIFPPLFNRYEGSANAFGNHVDNSVRTDPLTREHTRTDVSCTLFLSAPEDYDGGELVIEDTYGTQQVKLPAGHLVLYPGTSLHRVTPVTRGARVASFFWIQSLLREDAQRRLMFDLDVSIRTLTRDLPEHPSLVQLTGVYHNLLRRWAET